MSDRRTGLALCLASAAGFGAMAILAKAAYAGGAEVVSLLAVRFALAAVVLWALVAAGRVRAARSPRSCAAHLDGAAPAGSVVRSAVPGLLLGALYAVEAASFFVALDRIDAGLAELLLYGYPALVVLGAAALGRDALTPQRVGALTLATLGVVLVLVGGDVGAMDPVGVGAALLSSVLYAGYVLVSDGLARRTPPVLLTAQVITGAALALTGFGLGAHGSLDLTMTSGAWAAVVAIAIVCTVIPVLAFMAGMRRVGAATAAVVSTVEPVITLGLALVVLGERLGPGQLAGGALVLAALGVLSARRRPRVVRAPASRELELALA